MGTFEHFDLKMIKPDFSSEITGLIMELEHLRNKQLSGLTHPDIFFQLKHIFHMLESIGSARIEGNNTTVAEYIESRFESERNLSHGIIEIQNAEKAMQFIEENIHTNNIDRRFISELHKIVVKDLLPPPDGEGDNTPGEFRMKNVKIAKSAFTPPDYLTVPSYMEELVSFIINNNLRQYDLLKTAIAHHRFVWIHPFLNGNGRTVRLLTYAMLVKQGFNVNTHRILNPTAIFCVDRDEYYNKLAKADSGIENDITEWCEYVLSGLKREIEKIDRLLDYSYLKNTILIPAVQFSLERKYITNIESKILQRALEVKNQEISAGDLKAILKKHPSAVSRYISQLKKEKMLMPVLNKPRKYIISFSNNFLLRGIIDALGKNGFLAVK